MIPMFLRLSWPMHRPRSPVSKWVRLIGLISLLVISSAACDPTEVEVLPTDTEEPTAPTTEPFEAGEEKCVQFDGLTLGSLTSPLVIDWLTVTPMAGTLEAVDDLPSGGDSISELAIQDGLVFTHPRASSVVVRAAHFNTPVLMEAFSISGQHILSRGTPSTQHVIHQLEIGDAAITKTEVSTDEREGVIVEYCVTLLFRGWRYETSLEGLTPIAKKGFQNPLGGIVVAGSLLDREDSVWVLRTDYTGSPEWHKTYHGIHNISTTQEFILRTTGGGAVMIGRAETLDGDSYVIGVVKISPRGDVEFAKGLQVERPSLETGVVTSDGGFAVVASIDYDTVWLGKLDSQGTLEWNKEYSIGDPGHLSIFALAVTQTADNGYLIVGRTAWFSDPDPGEVWVIRLDAGGQILWQKTFGGPEQDGAYSVIETASGNIAVAGFTTSFGPNAAPTKQYFLVLTLDPNGALLQAWAYGSPDETNASIAYQVEETDNGGLLVSGQHVLGPDYLVTKLDSAGLLLWATVYETVGISDMQFRDAGGDEMVIFGNGRERTVLVAWADQLGSTEANCVRAVPSSIFSYPAAVIATDTAAIAQDGEAVVVPIDVFAVNETATQIGCGW